LLDDFDVDDPPEELLNDLAFERMLRQLGYSTSSFSRFQWKAPSFIMLADTPTSTAFRREEHLFVYAEESLVSAATLRQARAAARPKGADNPDPCPSVTPNECSLSYTYGISDTVNAQSTAKYQLDAQGRVIKAQAGISPPPAKRQPLGAGVEQMTDMLFNPQPRYPTPGWNGLGTRPPPVAGENYPTAWFHKPGMRGSRIRSMWHSGHILASQLGGSHKEPLNFFPQHFLSNSNNGRWYRMELIAAALFAVTHHNDAPAALRAACDVMQVYMRLDYEDADQTRLGVSMYTPTGGVYGILVGGDKCQASLQEYVVAGHDIGKAKVWVQLARTVRTSTSVYQEHVISWKNGPDISRPVLVYDSRALAATEYESDPHYTPNTDLYVPGVGDDEENGDA
jgi:hypothetical protein